MLTVDRITLNEETRMIRPDPSMITLPFQPSHSAVTCEGLARNLLDVTGVKDIETVNKYGVPYQNEAATIQEIHDVLTVIQAWCKTGFYGNRWNPKTGAMDAARGKGELRLGDYLDLPSLSAPTWSQSTIPTLTWVHSVNFPSMDWEPGFTASLRVCIVDFNTFMGHMQSTAREPTPPHVTFQFRHCIGYLSRGEVVRTPVDRLALDDWTDISVYRGLEALFGKRQILPIYRPNNVSLSSAHIYRTFLPHLCDIRGGISFWHPEATHYDLPLYKGRPWALLSQNNQYLVKLLIDDVDQASPAAAVGKPVNWHLYTLFDLGHATESDGTSTRTGYQYSEVYVDSSIGDISVAIDCWGNELPTYGVSPAFCIGRSEIETYYEYWDEVDADPDYQ